MISTSRKLVAVALAAGIASGLVACAPSVTSYPDYVAYESVAQMERSADQVLEVRIMGRSTGTFVSKFTGDDPETNPYAGDAKSMPSEAERTMDLVLYDAEVVSVYKGDAKAGSIIEISQLPDVPDLAYMEERATYVLFLESSAPGPAAILGGDQGQYRVEKDGLIATAGESALPLDINTLHDLAEKNSE